MHAYRYSRQDPRIRSPPAHQGRCPMTDFERLSAIQNYAWTLELLGEALVQHDEMLECEHNPHLSFRNTAGIHQAIQIISRLASEQCGKLSVLQDDPVS